MYYKAASRHSVSTAPLLLYFYKTELPVKSKGLLNTYRHQDQNLTKLFFGIPSFTQQKGKESPALSLTFAL